MSGITETPTGLETKTLALVKAVLINLVPLVGVFFFGWSALDVVCTYFLETAVVVAVHFIRLWYVGRRWGSHPRTLENRRALALEKGETTVSSAMMPFFMLAVFGLFWSVQLFILGGFAEKEMPRGAFTALFEAASGRLFWALASFAGIQLLTFVTDVVRGTYAYKPSEQLLFLPFRRILVQQLAVILGGFVVLLGGQKGFVIVLVLVKLAADLLFIFINHPKLRQWATQGDPEKEKGWDEMQKML